MYDNQSMNKTEKENESEKKGLNSLDKCSPN